MISVNPDVNVHIDTALAKPGMRRVEKLRSMLDSYYEGNLVDLSEYTEEIEELMDAYIDLLGKLESKEPVVIEKDVVLTSVSINDQLDGFYVGARYKAKDLNNGFFKVYLDNGKSATFSQKDVRIVVR